MSTKKCIITILLKLLQLLQLLLQLLFTLLSKSDLQLFGEFPGKLKKLSVI